MSNPAPEATPTISEHEYLRTISLLIIAGFVCAVALSMTRAIMIPLVLALFLNVLIAPLVDQLQQRFNIPRWGSIALTLLILTVITALTGYLLSISVSGFAEKTDYYWAQTLTLIDRITSWISGMGVEVGQDSVQQAITNAPILSTLRSIGGGAAGALGTGGLVMIFTLFLIIGRPAHAELGDFMSEIERTIRSYISTKLLTSAATGLLTTIILGIAGMDLAIFFGLLAFLLNFIPSVGSILGALLPLPIALLQFDLGTALIILALLGTVQIVIGNVIEPMIMESGLDLHPVTILVTLGLWGIIWGVMGMFLSAPLTVIIKTILARSPITRPIADLLAGRGPLRARPNTTLPSKPRKQHARDVSSKPDTFAPASTPNPDEP